MSEKQGPAPDVLESLDVLARLKCYPPPHRCNKDYERENAQDILDAANEIAALRAAALADRATIGRYREALNQADQVLSDLEFDADEVSHTWPNPKAIKSMRSRISALGALPAEEKKEP